MAEFDIVWPQCEACKCELPGVLIGYVRVCEKCWHACGPSDAERRVISAARRLAVNYAWDPQEREYGVFLDPVFYTALHEFKAAVDALEAERAGTATEKCKRRDGRGWEFEPCLNDYHKSKCPDCGWTGKAGRSES